MSENSDKTADAPKLRDLKTQTEAMAPADKADFTGGNFPGASLVDRNRLHEVAAGETLARIAGKFYDDPDGWERIFAANRDQLSDPDHLTPGQMLVIPPQR